MGILRADRITGLGGADAIKGSVKFTSGGALDIDLDGTSIGTSNFTIEAWVFWFGNGSHQFTGSSSNNFNFYIADDDGDLKFYDGSSTYDFDASPVRANEWTHVALVREGTSSSATKVYVNGVNTNTVTLNTSFSFDRLLSGINYLDGSRGYGNGYTSNLRVTLDAVYTSAFTPPSSELTVLDNTIVLCCQSPGNILQEATGKTIVPFKHGLNQGDPVASHFTPNSPVGFSTTTDVGSQYGTTFDGFGSFATSTYMVPPGGNTRERGRGRGLAGGGWSPSVLAQIYSVEIATDGVAADFGDLTLQRRGTGAAASHTRGVWAGGYAPGYQDRIDFVTIANTGNATDFGNLDTGRFESSGVGNDTRGVFGPCENPATTQNVIQYITFATTGNATDFGDSTIDTGTKKQASVCSTTRGIFAGGQNVPSPSNFYDLIEYITTATTGNATDFGDLLAANFMCTGVSDATRGVIGGGNGPTTSGANFNVIQFVTIATTGNAANFGDLTTANQRSAGMSNRTRGLFSGGATPNSSTAVNSIDKITIQTQGNATDFGDYPAYTGGGLSPATQAAGCSDSHGGLS